MRTQQVTGLLRQTFSEWTEDKAPRLGAALAYYAIFSIPPLVLLVIAIIGLVYHGDVAGAIQKQLASLMGEATARTMMETGRQHIAKGGFFAALVGFSLLLFGASGVFGDLQDALNTIWDVQPKKDRGIMGTVNDRFFSFAMVLGIAFLLLVSLVLSAAVAAVGGWMPGGEAMGHIIELALSFGVTTVLFAMIFKVLPDVKLAWNDVWVGAVATALLFSIGKFVIGLYLGKASIGSAYGTAGSVIVMIVWIYYSAQLLFLGAEFTQVYTNRYGSKVVPAEDAELVRDNKPRPSGTDSANAESLPKRVPTIPQYSVPVAAGYGVAALLTILLGFFAGRKSVREQSH